MALLAIAMVACSQGPVASSATTPSLSACRLPISIQQVQGGPKGAFLAFPSGKATIDPSGAGGVYYDRQFTRWLPQPAKSVSPDKSHYAFGGATGENKPILHIVDVASGADRTYSLPDALLGGLGGDEVFEYSKDVIYLGVYGEGSIASLWTFDIPSGVTKYVAIPNIGAMDGNIVWRGTLNASDSKAWTFVPGSPTNQIARLDLRDSTSAVWLYRPGHLLGVLGVDAEHHPIVMDFIDKQTVELLVLLDANNQRSIYKGSTNSWTGFISGVAADSHGVWFGTDRGIYLYSEAGGVKKVSDQGGNPAGTCA